MKIAVFGNYGVHNIGDDLILMGLVKKYKSDRLTVYCGSHRQLRSQFKLPAQPFFPGGLRSWLRFIFSKKYRQELHRAFSELRQADKILIGGGGILVDKHLKAVILWWRQLKAIRESGVDYEFIANSLELNHWWSRLLFQKYLRGARSVSVRDRQSQQLLHSLDVKAVLVPDLAWDLVFSQNPQKKLKLTESSVRSHRNPRKICLALCKWGLKSKQKKILRMFLQGLAAAGYELVGLAFQSQKDDDRQFIDSLHLGLAVKTELADILEELESCCLLIGMRYHSLLLAERLQVPAIALAYQSKVSNFMKDQQKEELCIPIQNLDQEKLQELFRKAVCN